MPKTKFEDLIFTIIMVVVIVYCMTLYNLVLELGFRYSDFIVAFRSMWYEAAAAFLIQRTVAGPIARKLAFSIVKPGIDKPGLITLAMAVCTALLMAPMMTLFVTIFHNGLINGLLVLWLLKLAVNFPFALCSQILWVGPLVRLIFRTISKKWLRRIDTKQI